jgi:hypothetical protein
MATVGIVGHAPLKEYDEAEGSEERRTDPPASQVSRVDEKK